MSLSIDGVGGASAEMKSVAVAVNVGEGSGGGNGSRRAVRWAVENLMNKADRFILVHVMPPITSIPTPSGECIPVAELDENVVKVYVQDVKLKTEEIFIPYKKLCKTRKVETLVLEDDNPASALLRYVSAARINNLVLGSCYTNCIVRKLKGPGVPTTVLKSSPSTCDIYVVSKRRVITDSANSTSTSETSTRLQALTQRDYGEGYNGINEQLSGLSASSVDTKVHKNFGASSENYPSSYAFSNISSPVNASVNMNFNCQNLGDNFETTLVKQCNSMASSIPEQSAVHAEIEKLRLELQTTVAMYERACEEVVHAQNKVQLLSSGCVEEARKVNAALERKETLSKIAAEEKAKHLQVLKEVEEAKKLLDKEAYERQIAEVKAQKESSEKQKIVDALLYNDRRYRRYTKDEIEVATDFFSENNVIGEGGYGKVYKCNIDHTPVAVKVLWPDAVKKKDEFLKEVEVLSQIRHPHMVLLLGACPEISCLVYEYLENGSLDEYILHQNGKPSLPWFVRFRLVFEVACGLAFLHNSKPEPIVHRDLKPGNILLDGNYVSKIGDVGLAKLMYDIVPDNITEYRDSIIAGTLHYMDPEYQRTGTLRPKSDLYAFGVIVLQLLTAQSPNGLISKVENAIKSSTFANILDKSVTDWPVAEAEELAQIALKCSKLRCRDRPDLDTEIMPVLKRLKDFADTHVKLNRDNIYAPNHFFCPILQEVMEDPYIAADGFTYEHRAIKAWLERHNVSPVTKLRLQHSMVIPNYTLRSAIQEWKSPVTYSGAISAKDC
ncbi:U-box domain-containing protein 34 [Pistacia vera]|uniref:U-box domain-containing protein 34 n=1 Tax=Pistacia vera TaxID=55513 RepID=UPI00126303E4|nr:U-box domain-containing protein 34 [Pistacia vera]